MKTRTLDAPNRRTFLSAADPDATLFVVETNGAAELAKVLQDNTTAMKVVGSQGLSVVVAASVWPDIDKALASIVVPVRRTLELACFPLHSLYGVVCWQ